MVLGKTAGPYVASLFWMTRERVGEGGGVVGWAARLRDLFGRFAEDGKCVVRERTAGPYVGLAPFSGGQGRFVGGRAVVWADRLAGPL